MQNFPISTENRTLREWSYVIYALLIFVQLFLAFLPQQALAAQTPESRKATEKLLYGGNVSPEEIKRLISEGADVNVKDSSGMTPLMNVIMCGSNPEALSALIKAGADVNARDRNMSTPLALMMFYGREPEDMAVLIEAGAICG